ncbi:cell wall-binding repeat-containing protein [Desulfosporosinus sp. BG]|uniref:cell wall-binding repeat-containing protein n=1 Tax=Desulfosporosinus sp. BG TaxID=1633135 RepID=UPI00083A28E9|nr:cell wall-binding repeat-containing protein [Desulfosporosinus sp. BG]ODA38719.1 N-acetylmuramoyl-L-alanine amidase [Desulfosporosinus sp. BG]
MKKTKKALASLAIAGMAMTMIPFNAFANTTIPTRLAGITAEQTAVAIADQTGYTGTAILASSASYGASDALTAGPLAAFLNAPILLQGPGAALNADTKAELTKLNVTKVYVTSGTAVISQGVINELKGMGITVESLGGVDRFETSVNIAKKMVELGAPVNKVAVAYGWLNQDALSIASVASAAKEPIILTEKSGLSASAKAFLAANIGITASDVIGGTGVIDASVMTQLPNPTRHYGITAYDTNNQVIQDFASSLKFDNVYVANGKTGIDALAGAPLAAQTNSAIVLTDGASVPAAAAFTHSKSSASTVVTALGGTAVVPENIRTGVAAGEVTTVPGDLAITSVTALDDTNRFLEIDFSKAVTSLEPSDITIEDAATKDHYGVQEVKLSANGMAATVTLYAADSSDANVLQYLTDYTVTVNVNGQMLTANFNRSYSMETLVQSIDVDNSKITVHDTKSDTVKTLKVLDPKFNYEAALGETVQVWYNNDNELLKSQVMTSSAKEDAIEVTKVDQIKMVSEDKKYDVTSDNFSNTSTAKFAFYVNGAKANIADYVGQKLNFAKVGFDKSGDIDFVSAYTLKDFLIFNSVDGDEVLGVNGSGSFDASHATIVKDGANITTADLQKGDVIFYNEDANGGDGYAEVYNNQAATGEITNVYSNAVEVGGNSYEFDYDSNDYDYNQYAVYIDTDGKVKDVDSDAAEALQAAGDVALYTDHAGNLVYISGDVANITTNDKVAVLTDSIIGYSEAKDKIDVEAVNQDGDELSYDINLDSLDTITLNGKDYDIDNTAGANSDWKATLAGAGITLHDNSAGTSTATDVVINFSAEGSQGHMVKLDTDDNGNLKQIEFFNSTTASYGYGTITSLKAGDTYVNGMKLTSGTIMFDATDAGAATKAGDYVESTFGDYNGSDITSGSYIYNDDNEVVAIWFDATSASDTTYDEAVVTNVLRDTDDKVVSLTVYAGGKLQTLAADKISGLTTSDDLKKGDVVVLEFDKGNLALVKDIATATHEIVDGTANEYGDRVVSPVTVGTDGVDVGNKKVTTSDGTFTLADNGLVLDVTDPSDISVKSLSDLRGETNVTVVRDATTGSFAKFFLYTK